ncbi:RsmB/NOP family class I SAM-dependent RNA methyltransferase [Caldivirga maquilingensis]|uniref:Fmu (Sun) domain protein n=1 Tax=Caldivirga maquilingensis (strain ATCC 700844 / DSM 13496 / JCM 10307 / IC-167) TaxID=397948 RepID=A8M8Z7_CALMQ|nr:RsmB/NOP family class I SAM-dependent RNA methyltransferase [Caldivirga maquilingensis]ABW02216.1 Fmu (Sun) domain protein [Caldivirga maquilingensis IC-167]
MVEFNLGADFVDFAADVMYIIEDRLVSMDKAFHYARLRHRLKAPLRVYYNAVSDVVRNYAYLSFMAKQLLGSSSRKAIAKTWLLLNTNDHYSRRLRKRVRGRVEGAEARLSEVKDNDPLTYLSIKYSFPRFIVEELSRGMGLSELEDYLSSLNRRVTWLRVNTLKVDLDKAIRLLEDEGVEFTQSRLYPFMLLVKGYRRPMGYLRLFKDGAVVPQDLASALVVLNLMPEPGDVIIDACAAPGMKTSLIMQLTDNKAEVIAIDVSKNRLSKMRSILRRMGVDDSRVHIMRSDSSRLRLTGVNVNKVLIDAPCTSSGAVSKDPGIKLILASNPGLVKRQSLVQSSILLNLINQLKDASIVYATCSILPEEGEEVIERINSSSSVSLVKPSVGDLSNGYVNYPVSSVVGRVMPHIHNAEGFFISKLTIN